MPALLANLGSPEMDRLAVELAARGELLGLVRRYANLQRPWERALAGLPLLGKAYASTLGRRVPPKGLEPALVIEAGVAADFAFALTNRLHRMSPGFAASKSRELLQKVEAAVAEEAARQAPRAGVVVANYHVAEPAFRAARAAGVPTVLNYPIAHHRWQYRYYAEQAKRRPEYAAALPRFGNQAQHGALLDREIELADVILVGSGYVRDTFVEEGVDASKLRVIPYGADPGRFQPPAEPRPADRFHVVLVGQLGERKGLSYLLDAFDALPGAGHSLQLVGDFVAGAEVYGTRQTPYSHTSNIPQALLPKVFQGADVFVLPTLVEGMPMVVLEAMACGLPVIGTPHGPSEVVRDGIDGIIVPPGDAEALRAALQRLKEDPMLRAEMGRNARERASTFTWERFARLAADAVLAEARST